jgi:hypothetical protein
MKENFQQMPENKSTESQEPQYRVAENLPPNTPPETQTPDNGNNPSNNERPSNPENIEGVIDQAFLDDIFDNSPNFRQLVRNLSQLGKGKKIIASDGYVYNLEDQTRNIAMLTGSNDPNLGNITRAFDLRGRVQKILLKKEMGME